MKLNKSLLIMALSLFAVSGLFAEQKAKKDEVPGVAAQPASYFYTGKPYDADLGAYTFKYRNYDPELKRWSSTDPSGFPDGANNHIYTNQPLSVFDPDGNTTQAIHLQYTYKDSNGKACIVEWFGEFVWSFDSKYERMTEHKISETGGLTGDTAGFEFSWSDSSSTHKRDDPSGLNSMDEIRMYCKITYTDINQHVTIVDSDQIKDIYGKWYE